MALGCEARSTSTSVRAFAVRLTGLVLLAMLLAFVVCSCHPPQHRAAEPVTFSRVSSAAPVVNIAPLPVRPVQMSQLITPDKCPAIESERAGCAGRRSRHL